MSFWKKMNVPNRLTLVRIALVPLIIAAIMCRWIPFRFLIAGLLFGAAAITDAFDGKIARRDHLVTDFGKFADPLADKILVISVLVCFVKLGLCDAVPLIIIIFREFTVTSVRLVAASNGKVIAANLWGKIKTVSQIVAIVAIFVMQTAFDLIEVIGVGAEITVPLYSIFVTVGLVLIWITAVITVISGVKYLVDNKEVISDI